MFSTFNSDEKLWYSLYKKGKKLNFKKEYDRKKFELLFTETSKIWLKRNILADPKFNHQIAEMWFDPKKLEIITTVKNSDRNRDELLAEHALTWLGLVYDRLTINRWMHLRFILNLMKE